MKRFLQGLLPLLVIVGLGTALPAGALAILLVLSVERAGSLIARMQMIHVNLTFQYFLYY